jgi:hypothetical protein
MTKCLASVEDVGIDFVHKPNFGKKDEPKRNVKLSATSSSTRNKDDPKRIPTATTKATPTPDKANKKRKLGGNAVVETQV